MNNQYTSPCFLETTMDQFSDLIQQDYKNIAKANQLIVFEVSNQEYIKFIAFDSKTSLIVYYDYLEVLPETEPVYIDFVCNFVNQILHDCPQIELHYIGFGFAVGQHQFRFASDFLERIAQIKNQICFYITDFHQSIYTHQMVIHLSPLWSIITQIYPHITVKVTDINGYTISIIEKAQQILILFNQFKELQSKAEDIIKQHDISQISMEDRHIYLNPFIINISQLKGLDLNNAIVEIINHYVKQMKILKRKQKKLRPIKQFALSLIKIRSIFRSEKNCHFPVKMKKQARCKVCYRNQIKPPTRTNYKCMSCDQSLCPTCFEEFHSNPTKYFGRSPNVKKQKLQINI